MSLPPTPHGWTGEHTATGTYTVCPHCQGAGVILEHIDVQGSTCIAWLVRVLCAACLGRGWQ